MTVMMRVGFVVLLSVACVGAAIGLRAQVPAPGADYRYVIYAGEEVRTAPDSGAAWRCESTVSGSQWAGLSCTLAEPATGADVGTRHTGT
jgi:hypothetical protein